MPVSLRWLSEIKPRVLGVSAVEDVGVEVEEFVRFLVLGRPDGYHENPLLVVGYFVPLTMRGSIAAGTLPWILKDLVNVAFSPSLAFILGQINCGSACSGIAKQVRPNGQAKTGGQEGATHKNSGGEKDRR